MRKLADIVDSVAPRDVVVSNNGASINSTDEIDHLVRALGSIVVAARDLSDEDHARLKRLILAAGDLMSSRDRLKSADRQLFETALLAATARRQG
ncbi:hypothetical protein ACVW1C_007516 [Bradyrhizobium sp. USDA 4011]